MSASGLPRLVRAWLTLTLPEDWRGDILRDLEEAWGRRRAAGGALAAYLWLWLQAAVFSLRFVSERVRELFADPWATSADLKLAWRSVKRAPFVALLAVVSLGVGIGAAVGGYTFIKGALFTHLPFPGGERIVMVHDYDERNRYSVDVGADEFLRRRSRLETFEYLAAFVTRSVVVGEDPDARTVERAFFATPDFLRMTEVPPMLGRVPDGADVLPGAEPAIVLPHSIWVTLTGSDPDIIGKRLQIGGMARTVIGVMPEGFGFPWSGELWIPVDARDIGEPLRIIGKYQDGFSLTAARAEMTAIARPDPALIEEDAVISHVVTGVTRPMTGPGEVFVLAIPIATLVMLLMVMATNVANLILARHATRAAEIAVRGALGASRPRIVGQLVMEVALIVAVAAILGTWASRAAVAAVESRVPLPFWTDFSLEWTAVAVAVGLGGLVTLVAGVAPALRATGGSVTDALRDGGRGTSGIRFGRLTGTLIVVEVTICVGFLSAATLLGQSLLSFSFEKYGLPAEETLIAQIYFGWPAELNDPSLGLPQEERDRTRREFTAEVARQREEIREAILGLPGVRMAAYGNRFPGNEAERSFVEIEGVDEPPGLTEMAEIGEGYLDLLEAEVLRGRGFDGDEYADALPVALVNEPFVRDRLGGANAIGRRVRIVPESGSATGNHPWSTIVGVVPDVGLNPGNPSNAAAIFSPLPDINVVRLAIRGDANPGALTARLVEIAARAGPMVRVQWSQTLHQQMREPVLILRGLGAGFLVMGLLALLLSAASIHAITACTVTRRTREIGIRQALGASPGRIVGEVLHRSALQLAVGATLGTALALGLLRASRSFPWEVRSSNVEALVVVVAALLLSGLSAVAQPLRRAVSIRPADAMRAE